MRQVVQNLKTGNLAVEDVPRPVLREPGILVRTQVSLISAGTERAAMKLAQSSLVGKARQRPDLVQRVLTKLQRDGFWATLQTVRQQLDRETPLGYSLCGEVIEVGRRASEFQVGQRVACAGAGYANHAEINYVPRLLAAPVAAGVSAEAAAYATVGAIALQGIRNADVRVGEVVVVLGLGLLGQLAVQLLRASGCRVVGLDLSPSRVRLAAEHGAEPALVIGQDDVEAAVLDCSRGRGADAVLITAATTSNDPVEMAPRLARDRGRVVMVGVTGMQIPRNAYYEKELSLIVSRSYGPGRYDPQYEEQGYDYPPGHVRWTENRNLEAFLDLVASGNVRPEVCTTHRFDIQDAGKAFEMVLKNEEPYLGVVLNYPSDNTETVDRGRIVLRTGGTPATATIGVSFIGAGGFARSVLLPIISKCNNVELRGVVTSSGLTARSAGKKFGFAYCASSENEVYSDDATHAVFIATRHARHADMVAKALAAGKAVFVEKPLAVSMEQMRALLKVLRDRESPLMVGFNRRFSPLAMALKEHLSGHGPMMMQYRCNAGPLPAEHWLADPAEGGRIVGEACHFVDLFQFLTDHRPVRVYATSLAEHADDMALSIDYEDGSIGQLIYTSQGPPTYSKERLEVMAGGRVGVIDDFRTLQWQTPSTGLRKRKLGRADKGHRDELVRFFDAIEHGKEMPIPVESLVDTTLVTLGALRSAGTGRPVAIDELMAELAAPPDGLAPTEEPPEV